MQLIASKTRYNIFAADCGFREEAHTGSKRRDYVGPSTTAVCCARPPEISVCCFLPNQPVHSVSRPHLFMAPAVWLYFQTLSHRSKGEQPFSLSVSSARLEERLNCRADVNSVLRLHNSH